VTPAWALTATPACLTLPCTFPAPPVLKNHHVHRIVSWARLRPVKDEAIVIARHAKRDARSAGWHLPIVDLVDVVLIWAVTDNKRRDASSSQPTLEAYIDGLVEGGLLLDDNTNIVARAYCVIERQPARRVHVEIRRAAAA